MTNSVLELSNAPVAAHHAVVTLACMDYGDAARAGMATLRAARSIQEVHPILVEIFNRYLDGDTHTSRDLILGLRARGEAEWVGAFVWDLACMITVCHQGTITPDPALPHDSDACEFINLAAPLVRGTRMPLLQTSLASDLMDRKWFVAGDGEFVGLVERVLAHATRWPDQLQSMMAGDRQQPPP